MKSSLKHSVILSIYSINYRINRYMRMMLFQHLWSVASTYTMFVMLGNFNSWPTVIGPFLLLNTKIRSSPPYLRKKNLDQYSIWFCRLKQGGRGRCTVQAGTFPIPFSLRFWLESASWLILCQVSNKMLFCFIVTVPSLVHLIPFLLHLLVDIKYLFSLFQLTRTDFVLIFSSVLFFL